MSTITPNGQIRFLSNVPIDSDYENSIDFLTETAQKTYFLGLTPVHTMIGATRIRDGVISVNALADNLLTANYMMFQNTNFSNKWFYAFITNIEYINNNMSYVYYQIDDIQTWLFDVTLQQCYVEREHTSTDTLFGNTVDEGIGTSEYTAFDVGSKTYSGFKAVVYCSATYTSDGFACSSVAINHGILSGLTATAFDLQDSNGNWLSLRDGYDDPSEDSDSIDASGNGLEKLNLHIYRLTVNEQKDTIVGIVIVPSYFVGSTTGDITVTQQTAILDNLGFTNVASGTSLDGGYVPKNKKMYNSPYCVFDVVTADGQSIHLQPEFLQTGSNLLQILSNISPSPSLLIVPKNYKGCEYAWDKGITLDAFPQACVSTDGYLAWVASGGLKQIHNSIASSAINGASGIVSGASSIADGNVLSGVANVASAVGNTAISIKSDMDKLDVAKNLPSEVKGSIDATPLTANKDLKITIRKMSLKYDVLVSIDNYFTMFGYKVNKIKTPSRRNRPHYTYLKTKGCKVNGGAPADAIDRIQNIYDNGIRFWVTPSEVGQYTTIDNSPS